MADEQSNTGRVWLVGAGPGDPGLITHAGLARLREADVVVFDALANPALLREARPDAELIDVGKRAGAHKRTQEQINALLVEQAKRGRAVVRLKGGDPYLFGRGAEELIHLARAGVACEVIPGITSGIAAPAMAGMPVTFRGLASTVTFVTGHETPDRPNTGVDYAALARLIEAGGTVCFYMGIGRLEAIATALAAAGLSEATPAGAVQWGTLAAQRSVRATLGKLAGEVERAGLSPPAIVVVGPVAGLEEPGLRYFEQRPLFGRRVMVTRAQPQASRLAAMLGEQGAEVIEAPTIEIVPPTAWHALDEAIRAAGRYDWVALTSANGVAALAQRLAVMELDARALAGVRLAVVGRATAAALREQLGVRTELVPEQATAEGLAEALAGTGEMTGARVLLVRGDIARPVLPERLRDAGAEVDEVTAYHTRPVAQLPGEAIAALEAGTIDWITFTSASTARNLVSVLGERRELLEHAKIASIGPVTSEAAREQGLTVTAEAQRPELAALVETICQTR